MFSAWCPSTVLSGKDNQDAVDVSHKVFSHIVLKKQYALRVFLYFFLNLKLALEPVQSWFYFGAF